MKLAALFLVIALAANSIALPAQQTTEGPSQASDSKNAAKAKAEVQKRGIGKQSRLNVTLRNQTEVKGYVSQIGDASFQITNPKTQDLTTIAYADVKKVRGPGFSRSVGVAIGIGVALLILLAFSLPKD
jgi:hypothetical protein